MIFWARTPRGPQRPPLAGYPSPVRRLLFWYNGLTDWQRVQYALATILFLLACGGYLLGLGSTVLLHRVEQQTAAMAAQAHATEAAVPTSDAAPVLAPSPLPTSTAAPPATVAPTRRPSSTPFAAPQIAEPPAAPRVVPAAPVVTAPRATAVPDRPRNLETSKPEPPAASVATPTPASSLRSAPTVRLPTAVRQSVATTAPATAPTPGVSASTPTRIQATVPPAPPPATLPPMPTLPPTPVRTPAGR
ncbi:MAG: hypothetical protein NVSMB2_06550 [Chloroflexota bacterium]